MLGVTQLVGFGGGAAADFNPADLFAAAEPGFYADVNPTQTGVAADDPIAQWDSEAGTLANVAQATGAAQPLLKADGASHYALFDGSDDYLWASSAPLYAAGALSIFAAVRGVAQDDKRIVAERSSSSTNPIYSLQTSNSLFGDGSTDDVSAFIRKDDGGLSLQQGNDGAAFDGTDHVIGLVDNGGSIDFYVDGVNTNTRTYTPGTLTMDRFSVGALLSAVPSAFFSGRVYSVLAIGREMTAQEIADTDTYMQGLFP